MSLTAPPDLIERMRSQTRLLVWSLGANVAMAVALAVLAMAAIPRQIVAVGLTDTGQAIQMVPLDKEYLTESRVTAFAAECLTTAFSHDFQHYRRSMAGASACFTEAGVDAYNAALAPLLDVMVKRRLVMSAVVEPAVIVRKGMRGANAPFEWEVQAPVTLHLVGVSDRAPAQRYIATMGVRRVALTSNVRGISLAYVNLSPATGNS